MFELFMNYFKANFSVWVISYYKILHMFTGVVFPQNLEHDNIHIVNVSDRKPKLIDRLIKANPSAIFEHDTEGLNPLMTAAQYGHVLLVHRFLSDHTQSMECRDQKGRNFLHYLRLRLADLKSRDKDHTVWICKKILEIPGVNSLTFSRDEDGNTPLHLAIMDRDFDLAQLILQLCVEFAPKRRYPDELSLAASNDKLSETKELIVRVKNNKGKTVFDLITAGPDIPENIVRTTLFSN